MSSKPAEQSYAGRQKKVLEDLHSEGIVVGIGFIILTVILAWGFLWIATRWWGWVHWSEVWKLALGVVPIGTILIGTMSWIFAQRLKRAQRELRAVAYRFLMDELTAETDPVTRDRMHALLDLRLTMAAPDKAAQERATLQWLQDMLEL